jgi:hypothetical protein
MPTPQTQGKRVRSVAEFCRDYAISRTKAYEFITSGKLRSLKYGAKRVIPDDASEAWLASMSEAKEVV